MTLRERVIVEVYTGVCMTSSKERNEVYKYMAEIMGRPVFTLELANKSIQEQLQEKSRPDFIALCAGDEQKDAQVESDNDIKYTSLEDEMLARSHRRNIGGEQWGL